MRGTLTSPAQVKNLLHEGRITKREASQRLESIACEWFPEPAGWWSNPVDIPQHCHKCGQVFWLESMLAVIEPSGRGAVYCSTCVDYSPVTLSAC